MAPLKIIKSLIGFSFDSISSVVRSIKTFKLYQSVAKVFAQKKQKEVENDKQKEVEKTRFDKVIETLKSVVDFLTPTISLLLSIGSSAMYFLNPNSLTILLFGVTSVAPPVAITLLCITIVSELVSIVADALRGYKWDRKYAKLSALKEFVEYKKAFKEVSKTFPGIDFNIEKPKNDTEATEVNSSEPKITKKNEIIHEVAAKNFFQIFLSGAFELAGSIVKAILLVSLSPLLFLFIPRIYISYTILATDQEMKYNAEYNECIDKCPELKEIPQKDFYQELFKLKTHVTALEALAQINLPVSQEKDNNTQETAQEKFNAILKTVQNAEGLEISKLNKKFSTTTILTNELAYNFGFKIRPIPQIIYRLTDTVDNPSLASSTSIEPSLSA